MTDSPMALFVLALVFLAIGELIAFFDTFPNNTLSERLRTWSSVSPWRKALLAVGLALLFLHIVYAWPA